MSQSAFDWGRILTNIETVLKILAIVVAGAWAYFNYFKGRTYRPRLELDAEASTSSPNHVIVNVSLKNVGLSKVEIKQNGSALRIFKHDCSTDLNCAHLAEWQHIATFPLWEHHHWIEPGELIRERRLIVVPGINQNPLLIEITLKSNKIAWTAETVCDSQLPQKEPSYGSH
jgi:hypothetical protein